MSFPHGALELAFVMLILFLFFACIVFLVIRAQKKKQQQRARQLRDALRAQWRDSHAEFLHADRTLTILITEIARRSSFLDKYHLPGFSSHEQELFKTILVLRKTLETEIATMSEGTVPDNLNKQLVALQQLTKQLVIHIETLRILEANLREYEMRRAGA